MEALKLKIFNVLTERISVLEFEEWLYNCEFIKTEIKSDSLIFDVININYRLENALNKLKKLSLDNFTEEELLICKLEQNCLKIVNSETSDSYKNYVLKIIKDFDFDNGIEAIWEFYNIYYSFNGYDDNEYQNVCSKNVDFKTKQLANSVLESLKNANNIEERIETLKRKKEIKIEEKKANILEPKSSRKHENPTLKQKLFAFFKKI